MLLSVLNRKQKLKFLDLAMHMVSVDGKPNEFETRVLNMMLAEVGDNIISEYQFALSKKLEETIDFFVESNVKIRNIVYLNLMRVAMSDDFYNTLEHNFLEDLRIQLGIDDTKKKQLMRLVYMERDLRERAKRVVTH